MTQAFACLMIWLGALLAAEARTWPEAVEVADSDLEKVTLVEENGAFIYQSPSFQFKSPVRLLPGLIKELARTFEATKQLMSKLPWGIECRPPDGAQRYLAVFYLTREDYFKAGCPRNSGGVYMSKDKTFHIPFESLGIRKQGDSYTRDANYSNGALVHEITHQMMHDYLPFVPKWVSEGTAEFTEMIPYKAGRFRLSDHAKVFKEYGLVAKDLGSVFEMTNKTWDGESSALSADNKRQQQLYRQSAALVFYFNYLDGDPPNQGQRWVRYLEATKAESVKWTAYQTKYDQFLTKQDAFLHLPGVAKIDERHFKYPGNLVPPEPPDSPDGGDSPFSDKTPMKHLDILLDGRTFAQINEDLVAKFAKLGIH